MIISKEELVYWVMEGLDNGATCLLIIMNKDIYSPHWVMHGESIEKAKKKFNKEKEVADAIDITSLRNIIC